MGSRIHTIRVGTLRNGYSIAHIMYTFMSIHLKSSITHIIEIFNKLLIPAKFCRKLHMLFKHFIFGRILHFMYYDYAPTETDTRHTTDPSDIQVSTTTADKSKLETRQILWIQLVCLV